MEVHPAAVALDELGRAAPDVDDHDRGRVVGVALTRRAEEREPRLLVAGEDLGAQPEPAGHLVDERGAVGRVPDCAGQDGDVALGAQGVEALAVLRQRVADAVHRLVGKPAGRVDALPESRDDALAVEHGHALRRDVGGQQPRRVRSDVDDADAHQAAGCGIGSAASAASRLSTARSAIRARVECVAEPM